MNKKAAIEFSMTTIMIIIIGIAVLALGLAWVRGAFKQVTEISDIAFEEAKTQLAGELSDSNRILIIPSGLNLGANDQKTISIGCYNDDTTSAHDATLKPTSITGDGFTASRSTDPGSINSGGKAYWGVVIKGNSGVDFNTAPEVKNLIINCNGVDEERPLTITYK